MLRPKWVISSTCIYILYITYPFTQGSKNAEEGEDCKKEEKGHYVVKC